MNVLNHNQVSKETLLSGLDELYSLWKEEKISKRYFITEEELKTIYKKAHTFFIFDT
jgi:hypothetical protein